MKAHHLIIIFPLAALCDIILFTEIAALITGASDISVLVGFAIFIALTFTNYIFIKSIINKLKPKK